MDQGLIVLGTRDRPDPERLGVTARQHDPLATPRAHEAAGAEACWGHHALRNAAARRSKDSSQEFSALPNAMTSNPFSSSPAGGAAPVPASTAATYCSRQISGRRASPSTKGVASGAGMPRAA